jgi:hypothetical protein
LSTPGGCIADISGVDKKVPAMKQSLLAILTILKQIN